MDPDQVISIARSVGELLKREKSFDVAFGMALDGLDLSIGEIPTIKSVVGRLVSERRRYKKRLKKFPKESRLYRLPYPD